MTVTPREQIVEDEDAGIRGKTRKDSNDREHAAAPATTASCIFHDDDDDHRAVGAMLFADGDARYQAAWLEAAQGSIIVADGDGDGIARTSGQPLLLCHVCRVGTDPTSRHCNICDRCERGFDHHCVFFDGDVGTSNRLFFLGYLVSVVATSYLWLYTWSSAVSASRAGHTVPLQGEEVLWWVMTFVATFAVSVTGLLITQLLFIFVFGWLMHEVLLALAPVFSHRKLPTRLPRAHHWRNLF
jgi:hypothetical protein